MSALLEDHSTAGRLRGLLNSVLLGQRLVGELASTAIELLCDPTADTALQTALLAALRARGEHSQEVADLARALLNKARGPIALPTEIVLDTCGTGGDGSNSVNLSSLAALVVAACGVCVAKHGNRAVSSRCGSADLVRELGLPLHTDPERVSKDLREVGFAFLLAPAFHPAAKALACARRILGVRTVFNLLGPLSNPARPTHQVLGAADPKTARLMASALAKLDVQRAFVIHGSPGWDEATPCGPFLRLDVHAGRVSEEFISPSIYGLNRCSPEDLAGGDTARNTFLARAFLAGKKGPIRDAVLLNAALGLQVTGVECAPMRALERAAKAVDEGHAAQLVERLAHGERTR